MEFQLNTTTSLYTDNCIFLLCPKSQDITPSYRGTLWRLSVGFSPVLKNVVLVSENKNSNISIFLRIHTFTIYDPFHWLPGYRNRTYLFQYHGITIGQPHLLIVHRKSNRLSIWMGYKLYECTLNCLSRLWLNC